MSILITNGLTKVYSEKNSANEAHALEGVNLKIEVGEFVGIMGASGSGKSTLLKLLSGIEKPSSGTVEINNEDINKLNDDDLSLFRRHKLGFVFQNKNKIVTREILIKDLWDTGSFVDDNNLSVNITRVKNKLGILGLKEIIKTKRSVGYMLDSNVIEGEQDE